MQAPDLEAPASRCGKRTSANIALVEAALGKAAWIKAKVGKSLWFLGALRGEIAATSRPDRAQLVVRSLLKGNAK